MNECWLWFWRPIAEFLGALALLVSFVLVSAVIVIIAVFVDVVRRKIKQRFGTQAGTSEKGNP